MIRDRYVSSVLIFKIKLIIYNRDEYRIRNQSTFCRIYLILFMYALLFNDNCYYLLKNLLNIIYVRVSYRYSIYIPDYEILFSHEYYINAKF